MTKREAIYTRNPVDGVFKIRDDSPELAATFRTYYYSVLDSKDDKYFIAPLCTIKRNQKPVFSRAVRHCCWTPATTMEQIEEPSGC